MALDSKCRFINLLQQRIADRPSCAEIEDSVTSSANATSLHSKSLTDAHQDACIERHVGRDNDCERAYIEVCHVMSTLLSWLNYSQVTEITAVLEAEREAHCRRVSELEGRHAQESVVLREHVVALHEELQVCLIPSFRLHG